LQVGGALSTPFTLRCRENWDYSDIVTYDQDMNIETDVSSASGSPDYNIAMPMSLRAGAALTAGPFLVSGDVEMLRYNQIEYKTDPSSASLTQASANSAIQRHLQNVTNVHIGGEFTSPSFPVVLRGGYAVIRTPYRDVSYEKDRKVISAGIGLEMTDQLVFDVGFARTEWEGPADDLVLKQNLEATQVLVSLLYRMP
jgi:long-subunit fatty acid transport protein